MSGEAAFIEALRALATHPGARGLMDDAAVIEIGGEALVLTHDMMVEGVHFLPDQDPADVAWKLVAVNLSDLAAKGAEPLGVLLGFMLGDADNRFIEGLAEALGRYSVPLLGGDTVSGGPPRAYGLTAVGRAVHRPVPSRAGAQPGDALWLTGTVGAAMLDVSDGLLLDAWRMAEASHVSLAIDGPAVPIAAAESRRLDAMRWGDDYELLFTLPPGTVPPIPATRIGHAELRGFAPLFLDGQPIVNSDGLGWQHERT
jgi:thiamine-monophosphate kinase